MRKTLSRAVRLILAIVGVQLASSGHALVIDRMFVFGDSLSDPGNAAAMTGVAPGVSFFPPSVPSPVPGVGIPYDYRFTNGPVAMEYLAGYLGTAPSAPAWPALPANANPNFAVGGGMTGAAPSLSLIPLPPVALCCNFNWLVDSPTGLQSTPAFLPVKDTGLNDQVALFAARLGVAIPLFDPATTLFSVWGGPNDVFLALAYAGNPAFGLTEVEQGIVLQAYAINAALNIGTRIGELAALGAEHFLVLNMPNLGATPFAADADLVAALTGLSMLFNAVLDGTLDALRALLGINIVEFDTFAALDDLIASGAFAHTDTPCFDSEDVPGSIPTILAGCPGYLFFDGVHPTTAAHQILAQQLYRLIPEPGALALLAAALLALAWMRRSMRG